MTPKQLRNNLLKRIADNEQRLLDAREPGFKIFQVTGNGSQQVDITAQHIKQIENSIRMDQEAADMLAE